VLSTPGVKGREEWMIIYTLFPRLAGRFSEWERHLKRASEMGFDWIFVNPIQYPGFSGSLYSIKDYFRFNPIFLDHNDPRSEEEQVKEIINKAEEYGLRMMIDLVINHCAVDSELIRTHPEWFEWERKGKVAHPYCYKDGEKVVWGDLAKFNHRNSRDKEGMFRFFMDVIKYLISLGFRGFRCDAAYQIPSGFWKRLINEAKAISPDVIFVAETLGCTPEQTQKTASAGFDYIFNSSKWWDFHSPWLIEQYNLTRKIVASIGFPESHDTERLYKELNGNVNGLKQRYLFTALFSSGVMIPMGYEFGFRKKLHVVKTTPDDWEETGVDITDFIREVNNIKTSYEVFQQEVPIEFLNSKNPSILLMWKGLTKTGQDALLILNKDIHNAQKITIKRIGHLLRSNKQYIDISPEERLEHIPEPFEYNLKPGQGIVLVAENT